MNKQRFLFSTCPRAVFSMAAGILLLCGIACKTTNPDTSQPQNASTHGATNDTSVTLREGDVIRVTFPSATALNTQQMIRRDGRIALPGLGEVTASGLSPADLEKVILEKFGKDLVTKEVTVTMESVSYAVFVNGAVLRPGKIASNRPLTALEAIMEAGGFDRAKANLKKVRVIRTDGGNKTYDLDFSGLDSGNVPVFNLKPSDIVVVPERFNLF